MTLLCSEIIARVRDQLHDTVNSPYRYSDAELFLAIGAAQRKVVELVPGSCATTMTWAPQPGPRQNLREGAVANSQDVNFAARFLAVVSCDDLTTPDYRYSVRRVERDVLDSFSAAWPFTTINETTTRFSAYAADPHDPLTFWLFPAADGGVNSFLIVMYDFLPWDPAAGTDLLLVPDVYAGPVVDYVVHVCLLSEAAGADAEESDRYLNQFLVALGQQGITRRSIGQEAARPPEAKI